MPLQLSPVMVLFASLAVILLYGSQVRAAGFPEITDSPQPTRAATAQAIAKPSFLQTANQTSHGTTAAGSTGGHVTSQIAATTSNSETTHTTTETVTITSLITTNSTPSTSPIMHTLATPNTSHTAAPVTEATMGPSAAPGSLPTSVTPPPHTTSTNPSTSSHTMGRTTQPSNQTTLAATLSTSPHISTTSQKPTQPTHAPGTTTAAHNATQTASPATMAPGPTLAPQPSPAKTGIYQVLNGSRLCIKAEMGIQLAVQDIESVFSPQKYFNVDPNATQVSGNCGSRNSNLLLEFQGGFVNFTFTKDENSYYINEVRAYLTISNPGSLWLLYGERPTVEPVERTSTVFAPRKVMLPVESRGFSEASDGSLESPDLDNKSFLSTSSVPEKIYQGMKSDVVMFETVMGHSFKCVSEQSIQLSAHLQLKTMNVQLQAFDFEDDHFGNVDECSSDYTIVLPVIGAIVLGLCAVGLIVYGIRLRCQSSGYQRI